MAAETDGRAVVVRAPAKINLTLHITGRRDDGYHLLDSLVAFADLADVLTLSEADDLILDVTGPFAGALAGLSVADNLVLRAARRLGEVLEPGRGAHINLCKNLPVAAGIGGGSADAAATLIGLSRLWGESLPANILMPLGLGLGADVPVCLAGRPMYMSGIGERLDPAPPLPAAGLALVNPGVPLSTPAVFQARVGAFSDPARLRNSPTDAAELARALATRRNDLEAPARTIAPVIGEVLAALEAAPGCLLARMSGSGATCFGLFADRDAAISAVADIDAAHAEWWGAAGVLA